MKTLPVWEGKDLNSERLNVGFSYSEIFLGKLWPDTKETGQIHKLKRNTDVWLVLKLHVPRSAHGSLAWVCPAHPGLSPHLNHLVYERWLKMLWILYSTDPWSGLTSAAILRVLSVTQRTFADMRIKFCWCEGRNIQVRALTALRSLFTVVRFSTPWKPPNLSVRSRGRAPWPTSTKDSSMP